MKMQNAIISTCIGLLSVLIVARAELVTQKPIPLFKEALYSKYYYICYRETYDVKGRHLIDCTFKGWYSTAPWHDTNYHRFHYRPYNVCPRYYTGKFIIFNSQYETFSWWRKYCYKWHYTDDKGRERFDPHRGVTRFNRFGN